jgi:hypothetical protein
VVYLAPRARGDSVRPRRLSGVVVRPLNFPVRSHDVAGSCAPASFESLERLGCLLRWWPLRLDPL